MLHYGTKTQNPNNRYINELIRKLLNTAGASGTSMSISLQTFFFKPDDPAQLAAYNQFVDETFAAWCDWAEPRFDALAGAPGRSARTTLWSMKTCEALRAMQAGQRDEWDNKTRKVGVLTQNWEGCNWQIDHANGRRLNFTITGPQTGQ